MGLSIGNGNSPCFFSLSSGIRQVITQNFREKFLFFVDTEDTVET